MILKPAITVIMQSYNNERFIENAMKSILSQSFSNFELIIIDDGSTDNTFSQISKLTDTRIRCIRNFKSIGKYATYNMGLRLAEGKYVCFMDSDELSLPNRLKIQFDYMDSHPKIGCLGGVVTLINDKGDVLGVSQGPTSYRKIQVLLLKNNCPNYSSLMFKKSFLKKHNLTYNVHLHDGANYDFVVRASRNFPIRNIDVILVKLRIYTKQIYKGNHIEQVLLDDFVRLNQLKHLYPEACKEELYLHLKLMRGDILKDPELENGVNWLNRLLEENEGKRLYNSRCLYNLFENVLKNGINITDSKYFLTHTNLLNRIIQKFNYNSYLEIGVHLPQLNFDHIKCDNKIGLDPAPLRTDIVNSNSDQYFQQLGIHTKFDLIFIDGLHHYEQVIRDIKNALKYLTKTGTIVCHDMLPENEQMQIVPRQVSVWTGDCWKAWAYFRMTSEDLKMFVVNTDYGLGIIRKGKQRLFEPQKNVSDLDYSFFCDYRQKLMNTIDTDAFLKILETLDYVS